MFDVAEWWAGLTDQERELACRHRDDDPLPSEVVRQLNKAGVMWGDPRRDEVPVRWHWTSAVKDFLDATCE